MRNESKSRRPLRPFHVQSQLRNFEKRASRNRSTFSTQSFATLIAVISINFFIPHAATLSRDTQTLPNQTASREIESDQSIENRYAGAPQRPFSMLISAESSGGETSGQALDANVSTDQSDKISNDGEIVISSKNMSTADLELLKRSLLKKIGLDARPPADSLKNVPSYLWDLYDQAVDEETISSTKIDDAQFSRRHGDTGANFDVVRAFFPIDSPSSPTTLCFDLRFLETDEGWVAAELRVPWYDLLKINFLNADNERAKHDRSIEASRKYFRINLYEIVNETVRVSNLIDTKVIEATSESSATTFDVISIVSRASKKSNVVKFAIESIDIASNSSHSVFIDGGGRSDSERSVTLIMYGFDINGNEISKYKNFHGDRDRFGSRSKRENPKKQRNRLRGSEINGSDRSILTNRRSSQNLCQRRRLVVRFEDLNWQDWIIAPQEYTAYFCSGQCSYPFAEGQNATNHAVVQALVNMVSPRTAPRPACVPTETSSISLLYTDFNRNIVIKNYPDMIVEACGCR